jgi:hypothetical protein
MSRRFVVNLLAFFGAFFLTIAAGAAWADQAGALSACQTFATPRGANCMDTGGSAYCASWGGTSCNVGGGESFPWSTNYSAPPTSGPASNGGTGCNAGVSSGYSIPTPSGLGPTSVSMGGCVFDISTQAGNADGSRVGGVAVSTGVASVAAAAASAGVETPTGARRVINLDGSVTTTTVQTIPDGAGGTMTQVTESTVPAGGGAPVVSTSTGSGAASPGTGGGGSGGGGVGGLGTSPTTGGVRPSTETETPAATATAFVAPGAGSLPAASGSWYTSKYSGGLHGVWDARKTALFATPLGSAIANMAVPVGSGSEPTWTFTLWHVAGIYTLALPSWLWAVVKAILLLSAAFACRRIIFGG